MLRILTDSIESEEIYSKSRGRHLCTRPKVCLDGPEKPVRSCERVIWQYHGIPFESL